MSIVPFHDWNGTTTTNQDCVINLLETVKLCRSEANQQITDTIHPLGIILAVQYDGQLALLKLSKDVIKYEEQVHGEVFIESLILPLNYQEANSMKKESLCL